MILLLPTLRPGPHAPPGPVALGADDGYPAAVPATDGYPAAVPAEDDYPAAGAPSVRTFGAG